MPFTNEEIKKINLMPLVTIPDYTEAQIEAEHSKIKVQHWDEVKSWFKSGYLKRVLATSVIVYIVMLIMADASLSNDDPYLIDGFSAYIPLITLYFPPFAIFYSFILCIFMCPIPKWYRSPPKDHAEFNLRASLTKDQFEGASEDKIRQIFAYCNSALKRPL